MSSIILAVICILIVANLIVWTLATVALHTKKGCQKSHYFWCDSGWECCTSPNCAASKSLGTENGTKAVDSYKLTDRVYGTDSYYYQGCIQPMNSLLAALKPGEDVSSYNLTCIYCTPTNNMSGPGATPGGYKLDDSNGNSKSCTPSDCLVPQGFKYQGQTCSNPNGCNDDDSTTGMKGVLTGACAYLPFEDIPQGQNNNGPSTTSGNWLPFYSNSGTPTVGTGYSQKGSANFFAPGASNVGQYGTPAKWNYAPASGGPTLPTAKFSANNRMNNTWVSPSFGGPTNTIKYKNKNFPNF